MHYRLAIGVHLEDVNAANPNILFKLFSAIEGFRGRGRFFKILAPQVGGTTKNKANLISRVPMKRSAQPEENAEAILFLASDKVPSITGALLAADGGKLAR
jgi:NAD(P)-dependent dehydrogenase (short-subunit alcohol dehydrogenase family)